MRSSLIFLAGILSLIVVLVLSLTSTEPTSPERPQVVQESRVMEAPAPARNVTPVVSSPRAAVIKAVKRVGRVEGQQAQYQVMFATKVGGKGEGQGLSLSLSGRLKVTHVGNDEALTNLQFQLVDPVMSWQVGEDQPQSADDQTIAALSKAFYVTFEAGGKVAALHFERHANSVAEGLLKSVVAGFQHVQPAGSGDTYQVEESNTTGDYLAVYTRRAPGHYLKWKDSYLRVASAGGMVSADDLRFRVTASTGERQFGAEGWLNSLKERDEVVMRPMKGGAEIHVSSELSMTRLSLERAPDLVGALERGWRGLRTVAMSDVTTENAEASERAMLEQIREGATLESISASLNTMHQQADPGRVVVDVMNQAAALFELEPDTAATIPALVESIEDPRQAGPLLGALEEAGTPQSQAALVSLSKSDRPAILRQQSVMALGGVEKPTEETLVALQELAEDDEPGAAGTLALGRSIRRAEDSEARSDALDSLLTAFDEASSVGEKVAVMAALGNTGDPRILPAIAVGMNSDSEPLRAKSVYALRYIPGDEVAALIAETLLADPSATLRHSAAKAAAFRTGSAIAATLAEAMGTEQVPEVREMVLRSLGGFHAIPVALAAIEAAASQDGEEKLRSLAQALLTEIAEEKAG